MLLKSETSKISYPLLNTYVLQRIHTVSHWGMSITLQSVSATDVTVSNEYKTFLNNLEIHGM